ncbi:MAG: 3-oxoacyl-[acyl-carrier-protein] reductase [Candidatus Aquicultorales bacterium]
MLQNKVAVVTGGTRGIGRATALSLGGAGAIVIFSGRDEAAAEDTIEAVEQAGGIAVFQKVDMTDAAAVKAFIDEVVSTQGRLDVLVNNAGITRDGLLVRLKEEDWDSVIEVNLKSAFVCCQAAAKHMMKQRSGSIVNISSVVGLMGNAGQVNYAASKAGLIGMTKSLAKELAPRSIRVNAVAPGFIETEMTAGLTEETNAKILERIPMARFGDASEVAEAVLFLASDMSRYMTGQVLVVDGGLVM